MDNDANKRKRSNTDATTTVSALVSATTNSTATTDATAVLHLNILPHARARNHSALTALGRSLPDYDKPIGRMASALRASRYTTEIGIQKHDFGFTPWQSRWRVVAKTQWPTTYQSSCLQQYKTSSRDF